MALTKIQSCRRAIQRQQCIDLQRFRRNALGCELAFLRDISSIWRTKAVFLKAFRAMGEEFPGVAFIRRTLLVRSYLQRSPQLGLDTIEHGWRKRRRP